LDFDSKSSIYKLFSFIKFCYSTSLFSFSFFDSSFFGFSGASFFDSSFFGFSGASFFDSSCNNILFSFIGVLFGDFLNFSVLSLN
jgi:hypothetical protein